MNSLWHQILSSKLGQYSPDNRVIGIDYGSLFLDPLKAELALVHELSHSLLSGTSEFGQATEKIYQLLPRISHYKEDEREEIISLIREKQIFTQEGTATLMQLLNLRNKIGVKQTLNWAQRHLNEQYFNWAQPLFFILELSEKHRDLFTKKIPHLAMHTAFRKKIYGNELLNNLDLLKQYFNNEENCPDYRFSKLITAIKNDRFLVLKEPKEILEKAGINNFEDTTKEDVADFINYLYKLSGIIYSIKPEQIKDPEEQGKIIMEQAKDKIIVGNLNIKLAETAIFLPNTKDILHYKENIEIIFINFLDEETKWKKEYEIVLNKKIEIGGFIICKDGSKYTITLSKQEATRLINNELKDKTFIVKWGIYNFGQNGISSMPDLRNPNVVIYNTMEDLIEKLKNYNQEEKIKCLHYAATADSPLQGVIVKDKMNILHIVNVFGDKKISNFKENRKIIEMNIKDLSQESTHFNNAFSLWLGLDWRIDWYQTGLKNDSLYFRNN